MRNCGVKYQNYQRNLNRETKMRRGKGLFFAYEEGRVISSPTRFKEGKKPRIKESMKELIEESKEKKEMKNV